MKKKKNMYRQKIPKEGTMGRAGNASVKYAEECQEHKEGIGNEWHG